MNNFHIYEEIGRGKHSVVYKGRKKKSIEYVAIKSVDKAYKSKVLNEVKILHTLNQHNILKFHNWYETSNHIWLIVEYCTGGDLLNLVTQDKKLPESTVHAFGLDLLHGLQYIHSKSIIYCDLKPSNVLIDESGCLKLCDFGLAQYISDVCAQGSHGNSQPKRGTPCYMAPELFQDDGVHSFHSDFWALGCVLYELASGRPPFMSNSFTELMNQILYGATPPLENLSPEFTHLIGCLLQKHPARRPTWEELRTHDFWKEKISPLSLPDQPQFDKYLRSHPDAATNPQLPREAPSRQARAPDDDEGPDEDTVLREAPVATPPTNGRLEAFALAVAKAVGTETERVNVTRLSMTVKRNMDKETDDSYRQTPTIGDPSGDVELRDHDAELDFDDHRSLDDDEEQRVPDMPTQSSSDANSDVDEGSEEVMDLPTPDHAHVAGKARGIDSSYRPRTASDQPSSLTLTGQLDRQEGSTVRESVAFDQSAVVPLQDLLVHPSDNVVKPIVLNKKIEKLAEPTFDERLLPLRPVSLQEMLQMEQGELETFLTHIFKSIGGSSKVEEKVNTLLYLETLCEDTTAANLLVNSALMSLFVKMLGKCKSVPLKTRLCSVMGLLIRHATFIEANLSESGVVQVLTELLREKNDKLKRRAMATLGELLFYISTQHSQDKGAEASDWAVPATTMSLTARCLRSGEDEIVQHYAAKTVENIASHSAEYAGKFGTAEVMNNLLQLFQATRNEQLRQTTVSAMARLVRQNGSLIHHIIDKAGVKMLSAGLADPNPRIQQAVLNLLNFALLDMNTRAQAALADDKALVPAVMKLLEHGHTVIRGKASLSILLLSRLNLRWLLLCCDLKLVSSIEKLVKDKDLYVRQCMAALTNAVCELVPTVTRSIAHDIEKITSRKQTPTTNVKPKVQITYMQILLHVMTSVTFRPRVTDAALLQDLSQYLAVAEVVSTTQPDFKRMLLLIIEALSQHTAVLVAQNEGILTHLVPTMTSLLESENGDTRFLSLKMLSDILVLYLNHPGLYDPSTSTSESTCAVATRRINDVITRHVLPRYRAILSDEDPIPLYGLKTLSTILERNPVYVVAVHRNQLSPIFFDFLQLEHSNNNIHNIKIINKMLQSPEIPLPYVYDLGLVEKVSAVIEYAFENSVESFFEPLLDLLYSMLAPPHTRPAPSSSNSASASAASSEERRVARRHNQRLLGQVPVLLRLADHVETAVQERALACIELFAQEYGNVEPSFFANADYGRFFADALRVEVDALSGDMTPDDFPVLVSRTMNRLKGS